MQSFLNDSTKGKREISETTHTRPWRFLALDRKDISRPASWANCFPLLERKGMPTMSLWYDANRIEFISKTLA